MDFSFSSLLPTSLHPAVVHFPIALVLTAALVEAGCLVFRRFLWLDRAAAFLMTLGGIGAGVAYLTGERAAEAAAPVTGVAQGVLADHEDLAMLTLIASGVAIALRLFVSYLGRDDLEVHLGIFRLAALVLVFAAAALIVLTAFHGGQLVFDHGIGVSIS